MLETFLQQNEINWLIRTTDDVHIDQFDMIKYMNDLESMYNPINDTVIRGHFIEPFYLHGGPGWIMSRKACVLTLRYIKQKIKQSKLYNGGDDIFLGYIFKKIFKKSRKIHSYAINGAPLSTEAKKRLAARDFRNLPDCPENVMNHFRNIVINHAGDNSLDVITKRHIFNKIIPDDVYLFVPPERTGEAELCYSKNATIPII
ncbi:hypothetical protein TVAG_364360 [Trichomonas vaginalis G3]|uniref:Uncharacterized protein n=1 Tax=Trichomonas vaginalis (strain ATCC PRA-98 / G3) TaxID=412133 RepID=A2E9E7_TRIV3|nr:hypothetical protein TVAGG3_0000880 [Trichomonas vaginalis G3]EAY10711.1 hypothetical protein TVAG_364360 [Trichomonas vaginalis G3]KAI5538604.1 hypothetical protein TVAGG3_0000880 [Trichomonas vaginalis G3]|eukprot:XP_001322934.1 hypothetical protein [Trichomonas vaginalis G3]